MLVSDFNTKFFITMSFIRMHYNFIFVKIFVTAVRTLVARRFSTLIFNMVLQIFSYFVFFRTTFIGTRVITCFKNGFRKFCDNFRVIAVIVFYVPGHIGLSLGFEITVTTLEFQWLVANL